MAPSSYPMRDGSLVGDPRLGRLIDPETSRARSLYPMHRLLDAQVQKPLRSYTWSVGTWLNQGSEGACVSFAFNHELIAKPRMVKGITNESAREDYWEIQKRDSWEGGSYPDAYPFYEGTSVLAGAEYFRSKGHYSSYWWANTEIDIAYAVSYKGPVVIGVNWYEGMLGPDRDAFLNPAGSVVGGHAVLVHAIAVREGFYSIWNSWGPEWGYNGRAKISRDTMRRLLGESGEAVIPIRK